MKETITRCSICKKTNCDGREWVSDKLEKVVCTNQTHIAMNGQRVYKQIYGHGVDFTYSVEEKK